MASTPLHIGDMIVPATVFNPRHPGPIFALLAHHLPATDLAEVRAIVTGIEARIAASTTRFGGNAPAPG